MKYVVFYMCRTIKILISNWPRKLKFSQFLQAGKTCQLLLTFLTKVTRWSRSTSNFYALIGQIWRVNSCGKFMQHLETCLLFLTAEADIVLCQLVRWCFLMSFSTGWTKWNTAAIKSLLLFMADLFIGSLVEKCVACQSRKFDFGWHRFRFSPCLIRKRSLKVSSDSGLTW